MARLSVADHPVPDLHHRCHFLHAAGDERFRDAFQLVEVETPEFHVQAVLPGDLHDDLPRDAPEDPVVRRRDEIVPSDGEKTARGGLGDLAPGTVERFESSRFTMAEGNHVVDALDAGELPLLGEEREGQPL
ncbi:hypothetical protein SDC9_41290 [bioreactor metagenome]|uniref:Uncharacterized protein n=1 Tax=bioreactor metagenome TaxID=1076179 RepID=A0A644VUL0_9ZZZZ